MTAYDKLSDLQLSALVAERVMGISLIPPREKAMVAVAWKHISSTGKFFSLRNGEELEMPAGATLPQPEGVTDWNARYALYVAKHLGNSIAAEVHAVRETAEPYSTDDNAARLVRDRIAELGLGVQFTDKLRDVLGGSPPAYTMRWHYMQATPKQQCIAALMALDSQTTAKAEVAPDSQEGK